MSLLYEIPNNLIQEIKGYQPSYQQGRDHFFYANTDELSSGTDFSLWELALYSLDGTKVEDLGHPTKDIISGSDFRWYIEFNITTAITGKHFFAVYNTNTLVVKWQSSMVNIISASEIADYTLVEWRHSNDRDNYNYDLTAYDTKYNSIFLDLILIDTDFEHEIKGINEQSTGKFRRQKNQRRKFITLESQFFDQEMHELLSSISDHDEIRINEEPMTVKESYSKSNIRDSDVSNGTWVLYWDAYAETNLNG